RISERLPALSTDAELVIYRVAQEALTNVVRHSGSRRAELRLEPDDGRVVLTVRDEGRGIGPGHAPGSGIRGMRERAGLSGAALPAAGAPDADALDARERALPVRGLEGGGRGLRCEDRRRP